MPYIQFLGAAGTVTGSKHLINTTYDSSGKQGFQVLIDCGLFQGQKEWRERNWKDTPVPAREIDAVVLTHAHLDHCGWIPRLVKEGFHGAIYATQATIDLCSVVLPDSGHLQEEDAAFHNKKGTSKHSPALPLYTLEEAQDCLKYFKPVEVGTDRPTQSGAFLPLCARGAHFRFVHGGNGAKAKWAHQAAALYRRHWARAQQPDCSGESGALGAAGGRSGRCAGDGIDVWQPEPSGKRSAAGAGASDSRHGGTRRQRDRSGVCGRAYAKICFHSQGADGVGTKFPTFPCIATARWRSRRWRFS